MEITSKSFSLISLMNAKELQAAYAEEQKLPVASFTAQAPLLEAAAEQVAERIE